MSCLRILSEIDLRTPKILVHHQSMIAALLLASFVMGSWQIQAPDPQVTTDFAVEARVDISTVDGNFATSTALHSVSAKAGNFVPVSSVNVGSFAALQGPGVSSALPQFPPGSVTLARTHPRGTEVLFVMEGSLDVGLIDITYKLLSQTLLAGDLFLVHFHINWWKHSETAKALAGFSSSNPGLIPLPNILFRSNIWSKLLAKSYLPLSSNICKQRE